MKFGQRALYGLVAGAMVLSSCTVGAQKPTTIKILAPANQATVKVGQSLAIQWTASGDNISRVDVAVNNQVWAQLWTQDPKKGVAEFPGQVEWTPLQPGTASIQLKAYNPDEKLLGQSDLVVLNAQGAVATATAVAQPTVANLPKPTAGPTVAAPTATPDAPSLTVVNDFVNVREGPNTAYRTLGQLKKDDKAVVKGRNEAGTWFQIAFNNGVGWVFGELVQANDAANKTAVAAAPPLPTLPPATPTPIPTATTPPVSGVTTGNLSVDKNKVGNNGSVVASWNVQNIREALFDKGDGGGYKAAGGTMSVVVDCITSARTIRLRVTNNSGAVQEDVVTIQVDAALPGGTCSGGGGTVASDSCTASNPYWKAVITGNSNYTFCAKQDLEYVGGHPSVFKFKKGTNPDLSLKWNIFGIGGIELHIDPSTGHCSSTAGSKGTGRFPTNGSNGPDNFIFGRSGNDFDIGEYKLELYIINQQGQTVGYNEKFFCVEP
ncbi:MAG: SH3 domain-containing protein [Thermoflexales bacterium]|nr:SH3 domain-containing protein [Thermoflexales bacterium]